MATIICPVCETRYETAAAFPPEGRKVRCSKCGHVWMAKPIGGQAAQAQPAPRPAAPAQAAPRPNAPPAAPPAPPRPQTPSIGAGGLGGMAGMPQAPKPQPQKPPPPPPPPPLGGDAGFDMGDGNGPIAQYNSEAMMAGEEAAAAEKSKGGIFGRLTKRSAAPPPPPPVPPVPASGLDPALTDAYMGDGAGAMPGLDAPPDKKEKKKKGAKLSPVAMGWAILALLLGIVLGIFFLAPGAVMSVMPGAARIYSLIGMPVGARGLAFEGVRYGWANDGGQTILEVQGDVVNNSGATVDVPTVVIALRDEKGEEISEWTTEVGDQQLAAGAHTPFLRQIPSPPSNVRSVKVRFAKAE